MGESHHCEEWVKSMVGKAVRRQMGSSSLALSPLGLGCWQFSNGQGMVGKFWPVLKKEDVRSIVQTSLKGGVNWFDTAEVYGKGQSEQMLAEALREAGPLAEEAHIATKWWPAMRTASSITSTIDERIRLLENRTIELHQIHQPFSFSSVREEMNAMADLVKRGKIKNVGVSNFSADKMRVADRVLREHGLRRISNQVKYSLLDRRIEHNGIMDAATGAGCRDYRVLTAGARDPQRKVSQESGARESDQGSAQIHLGLPWCGAAEIEAADR